MLEGVGIDAAGRANHDRANAGLFALLDDRSLGLAIAVGLVGAHRRIGAVVHAEAGGGHGRVETQHVVSHLGGEAPRRFTAPAELRGAQVGSRLTHQQVIFHVERVEFLFGDRIADDGDVIAGLHAASSARTAALEANVTRQVSKRQAKRRFMTTPSDISGVLAIDRSTRPAIGGARHALTLPCHLARGNWPGRGRAGVFAAKWLESAAEEWSRPRSASCWPAVAAPATACANRSVAGLHVGIGIKARWPAAESFGGGPLDAEFSRVVARA